MTRRCKITLSLTVIIVYCIVGVIIFYLYPETNKFLYAILGVVLIILLIPNNKTYSTSSKIRQNKIRSEW